MTFEPTFIKNDDKIQISSEKSTQCSSAVWENDTIRTFPWDAMQSFLTNKVYLCSVQSTILPEMEPSSTFGFESLTLYNWER